MEDKYQKHKLFLLFSLIGNLAACRIFLRILQVLLPYFSLLKQFLLVDALWFSDPLYVKFLSFSLECLRSTLYQGVWNFHANVVNIGHYFAFTIPIPLCALSFSW